MISFESFGILLNYIYKDILNFCFIFFSFSFVFLSVYFNILDIQQPLIIQ